MIVHGHMAEMPVLDGGDLVAPVGERSPGFVTKFPVVGIVIRQNSRKASTTAADRGEIDWADMDAGDGQPQNASPQSASIGSQRASPSHTLEHIRFCEYFKISSRASNG